MATQDQLPNKIGIPPELKTFMPDLTGLDINKILKKMSFPKFLDPNNPTIAAADPKEILDAIKQVDPGNISGVIKKALDAMLMLRNIDMATGGGGVGGGGSGSGSGSMKLGMVSSGLRRSAHQIDLTTAGNHLGLKKVLDAFNEIMPDLKVLLSGDPEGTSIVNQALFALITDQDAGILSPESVNAANELAKTIQDVTVLIQLNPFQASVKMSQIAGSIGASSLGIDPNSLAYKILVGAVGQKINQNFLVNGVPVSMIINIDNRDIFDSLQLQDIPNFTGNELVIITQEYAAKFADQITIWISTNTLTAKKVYDLIYTMSKDMHYAGMQAALGFTPENILSKLASLLPQIASLLEDVLKNHVPKGQLRTVPNVIKNHATNLAIVKKKLDIAQIFGSNSPLNGMSSLGSLASLSPESLINNIQSILGGGSSFNSALTASFGNLSSMASTIVSGLSNGLSPLNFLDSAPAAQILNSNTQLANQLSAKQILSLMNILSPATALSLLSSGGTILGNLSTHEINILLKTINDPALANSLISNNFTTYTTSGTSFCEQGSDIAIALVLRTATAPFGTSLKTILPSGITVICKNNGTATANIISANLTANNIFTSYTPNTYTSNGAATGTANVVANVTFNANNSYSISALDPSTGELVQIVKTYSSNTSNQ